MSQQFGYALQSDTLSVRMLLVCCRAPADIICVGVTTLSCAATGCFRIKLGDMYGLNADVGPCSMSPTIYLLHLMTCLH